MRHISREKINSSSDNLEKFLWVILEKRVQFFESYFPKTINLFFESYILSNRNVLWVILKNGVIFFDSCWKEGFNLYEFFFKCNSVSHVSKKFNSESHVQKRVHHFGVIVEKTLNSSIQIEKKFHLPSHKKVLILGVKKSSKRFKGQFFESFSEKGSISLSHIPKKKFNSVSRVQKKKVQFFESHWKKVQLFASHWKKGSFFLSHVNKKVQFFESFVKRVQFFQSYSIKCSILWITWEKTILWVVVSRKRFNSVSHIRKNPLGHMFYRKRFNSLDHI